MIYNVYLELILVFSIWQNLPELTGTVYQNHWRGSTLDNMAEVQDCSFELNEFAIQSRY